DDGEGERGSAISLGDVVSAARRRIKLIAIISIALTVSAALVIWLLPNRYEAVASVQIDQRNKEIVNIKGVISDLKADAATVDSEVEVIRSKQVTHRVIEELGLRQDVEFVGLSRLQTWLAQLGIARGGFKAEPQPPVSIAEIIDPVHRPERDEIARAFDQRLKVNRVRNTLVLEIHFTSADPLKAARIANAIAETYIKMQIEQKTKAMVDASSRLGDALRGVREKVAIAERAIERFKSQHDIFDADGHLLVDRQLAREMEALVLARNRTFTAKSRYEQARRMMIDGEGNESLADVLQSNTVRLLRDEFTKALRKQAEAGTKYGPKHPEMQKIGADVAKAQSELGSEVNKIIKNLKTEFDVAVDGERQQETRLEQLKSQIANSREKQWQLRELEREATASKQLYEALLARNKQTVETQGLQFPDARVVELADVPLYPMSPKRKQLAAIAAAGSFALALAIALFLELGSGSFARPRDIETVLDLTHLGSLPGAESPHALSTDPMRTMRMVLAEPRGLFAEAMRGIRHELDNRIGRAQRRVILIVSSLPNEGRSVIASNLALHYAAGQAKTLLIDADMRNGGLSRDLGVADQPGLIDVLAGGATVQEAILHDRSTGLHVMTAARRPDFMVDAASLLESHQFLRVLEQLRSEFDIIIIDAPPLLPVVDARVIAGHAEAIVFVTAWRRTPRQLAKEALKTLGPDGRKVVGAVVNQVDYSIMVEDWSAIGRPYVDAIPVHAGQQRRWAA
ncbi:MAG: polysaccharide biosynthesis tyrosine autokinase, partial [Hyphomicrobiaceae bacterium]